VYDAARSIHKRFSRNLLAPVNSSSQSLLYYPKPGEVEKRLEMREAERPATRVQLKRIRAVIALRHRLLLNLLDTIVPNELVARNNVFYNCVVSVLAPGERGAYLLLKYRLLDLADEIRHALEKIDRRGRVFKCGSGGKRLLCQDVFVPCSRLAEMIHRGAAYDG